MFQAPNGLSISPGSVKRVKESHHNPSKAFCVGGGGHVSKHVGVPPAYEA